MEKLLQAGKIVTTHGIRGELKIDVWCDSAEFLKNFKVLFLQDGTPLNILRARVHKQALIVMIQDIDNIDKALSYVNKIVHINKHDANLEKGVYFIDDLMGLSVVDADTNELYGKITDVLQTGSNDSYAVTNDKGETYYIPAIAQVIIQTDISQQKMLIRPIKGMFE